MGSTPTFGTSEQVTTNGKEDQMADWTVLGIAALGTVGTISAGVLGFAGPSWNERRLQAARDHKELRQAIRLVKGELKDILSALRTPGMNLLMTNWANGRAALSLIRAPDETEWHHRRETIALLTSTTRDEDAWKRNVIMFRILLNQFVRLSRARPGGDVAESAVESVAGNLPQLIALGKDAESRLDSLGPTSRIRFDATRRSSDAAERACQSRRQP